MTIEFQNHTPLPLAIRFIVTKMGNFYVDIEEPSIETEEAKYTTVDAHKYDIVELQPE